MPVRLRRPPGPARSTPVVADAREQALWDAGGRPRHRLRLSVAMVALGVAVVLVLGGLVIARARPEGDILALGSTTATTLLASGVDPATPSAGAAGDLSGVAPGDTVPGGGPAGAAPPAGVAPPAGAAGTPGAAAGGTASSGPGAAGGAGAGVPVPTTGPGGPTGPTGTSPTTLPAASGATTPTPPTTPAVAAPLPLPAPCLITGAAASPNPVKKKGNKLRNDVEVTFRGEGCGAATFQVALRGITPAVVGTGGGGWSARIDKDTSGWSAGAFPITITGGGAVASVILEVTS